MSDVAAVPKTFTQADVDDAKANGYQEGYYMGLGDGADRLYNLRRDVKVVTDNLRAGLYTELRAIQELEALIGP